MEAEILQHWHKKAASPSGSFNLTQPILGELLNYEELRMSILFSTSEGGSQNDPPTTSEILGLSNGAPKLNSFYFGLKTRGEGLPGDAGVRFIGVGADPSVTSGSFSYRQNYSYPTLFFNEYSGNFPVKIKGDFSLDQYTTHLELESPLSGYLHENDEIVFSNLGNKIALVKNSGHAVGSNHLALAFYDGYTLSGASGIDGQAIAKKINGHISFGIWDDNGDNFYQTPSRPESVGYDNSFYHVRLPSSQDQTESGSFATALMLKIKINNKGSVNQSVNLSYDFERNIGNPTKSTAIAKLSTMMERHSVTGVPFSGKLPDAFFLRWPLENKRMKIYSFAQKKFA